jgi:hypothetical protein
MSAHRRRPPPEVRDATKLAALVLERRNDEAMALARQIAAKDAARRARP